jgi:hypothetical protein
MKLSEIKKIDEMNAIAAWGDWNIGPQIVAYISKQVIDLKYEQIGEVKLWDGIKKVLKIKSSDFYIVGDFITKGDETKFQTVFEITFEQTIIPNHLEKYMNVNAVKVSDTQQGRKVAFTIYRFFVKDKKFNILGDEIQYFGARRLWKNLSKEYDVRVDIINFSTGELIEEDVILHHGTEDWDFDERVWSYDIDKIDIRLILREIIE